MAIYINTQDYVNEMNFRGMKFDATWKQSS